MDSRNDSGTELDDEDIKYGDVEGVCLDSESAIFLACDLTPSWGASVVDVNKVAESIAALESINVDGMEDSSLQDTIHSAASVLLDFLQSFTDARSAHHTVLSQHVLGRILRPSFLSRLFEYRHVCNLTAANTLSQSEHSVFISWTDVAIARLGEAILWVGGGCVLQNVKCSKSAEELALDAFMNSPAQKEKLVRVASQLPVTWQATAAVSGSRQASEAARRLSLALVFGAYVLCPKLTLDKRPHKIIHDSNIVHTVLQKIISNLSCEWLGQGGQVRPSTHYNPRGMDIIIKCQYAMVVSLFAQLEMSRETTEARYSASFRPSTLGTLMILIEYLMTDESTCETTAPLRLFSPLGTVNPNHCRLLGWESTVPWCWIMWGSGTSVHFESVTQITATWLLHFASTVADIERTVDAAPLAAMAVFLSLIVHPISKSYDLSEHAILYKACFAVSHIARRYHDMFDDVLLVKTYQRLFTLLLSLSFSEIDMLSREVILEFIAWAPRRLTEMALPLNQDNNSISAVINDAIERVTGGLEVEERSKHVKSALEVLVVLAWSRIPGVSHMAEDQVFVDHLLSMLGQGSCWDKATQETGIILLGCIVGLIPESDQSPHQPALVCTSITSHIPSDDLTMAAAIAVYIHGVAKLGCFDSITSIELWDYLRDVMLMILGKRQPDNMHHLSSLTRNTICSALSLLLAYFPRDHVGVLINSPWTLTLYDELRKCSQGPFPPDSPSAMLLEQGYVHSNLDRMASEGNPRKKVSPLSAKLYTSSPTAPSIR